MWMAFVSPLVALAWLAGVAAAAGPSGAAVQATGGKTGSKRFLEATQSHTCAFTNPPVTPFYWEPECHMGMVGCNADAKHVQCRFCGEGAYADIQCRPSLCTFLDVPVTPYFWDEDCEMGVKGCNADGKHVQCRWCGVGAYKDISCPGLHEASSQALHAASVPEVTLEAAEAEVAVLAAAPEPPAQECTFTNPPVTPFYWEPECQMGTVGCNADGKHVQCRFCGEGAYADIRCRPSLCSFPDAPVTPYYWAEDCRMGVKGCNADGKHVQCRWCGAGAYQDIRCLGAREAAVAESVAAKPTEVAEVAAASSVVQEELPATVSSQTAAASPQKVAPVSTAVVAEEFQATAEEASAPSAASAVLSQECTFVNLPVTPFHWEPECEMGMVGCNADGKHVQCRFCGEGAYADIRCRPSLCSFPDAPVTPYYWAEDIRCLGAREAAVAESVASTATQVAEVTASSSVVQEELPATVSSQAAAASPQKAAPISAAVVVEEFEATAEEASAPSAASVVQQECTFANPPVTPFYWEPECHMGMVGCNADGKHVQCRFCGQGAYAAIPCRPALCSFPNMPTTPYFWDEGCAMGVKGCNADGQHVQCRFCGEGAYQDIPCGSAALATLAAVSLEPSAAPLGTKSVKAAAVDGAAAGVSEAKVSALAATAAAATTAPPVPRPMPLPSVGDAAEAPTTSTSAPEPTAARCQFPNRPVTLFYWEPECHMGMVGCNADGQHVQCRFCGQGAYAGISCRPSLCSFAVEPVTPYIWDEDCAMGIKGCNADGQNVQCRFCGIGAYEDIPCEP